MSELPALQLGNFLTSESAQPERHPSIGCHWYRLEVADEHCQSCLEYASRALREAYVDSKYLAAVLEREGFAGVARLLKEKFPSEDNPFSVRTGDFGEVIGHIVLQDIFGFTIPVFKLRYKTNWEKAAFGVDIIAFRLHETDPSQDTVAFSEVKASKNKTYGVDTVFEEIKQLVEEGQPEAKQKMRNAVRFVSERLFEQQQSELEKRIYRFLDCYTNPHYIEAFFPLLVRDKHSWGDDALDEITLEKPEPNRVKLCIFLINNLEEAVKIAYEKAAQLEHQDG